VAVPRDHGKFIDIVMALRTLMKECAPDAKEVISYGIPAYKGKRMLAVISPTKKGITFQCIVLHTIQCPGGKLRQW
jgi:uncharacterized protein YdhG (YjbR/CyaY superfamily)